jgi:hypothetical protein
MCVCVCVCVCACAPDVSRLTVAAHTRRYLANEELIDFIENGVKQNGMIITKVRTPCPHD